MPHLPTNSFIDFQLVSVTSPTRFVIKITSHMVNNKWISWKAENETIEQFLEQEFQELCKSQQKCKPSNVKVGESYAVLSESKWKRCRVVDKQQP
jgi:hypothetical protein